MDGDVSISIEIKTTNSNQLARTLRLIAVLMVAVLIKSNVWAQPFYQPPDYSHSQQLRGDAALFGVAAERETVLAVGANGTILRLAPEVGEWTVVESSVDCQLDDVTWLDDRHALAVGGAYDPITNVSRGCVVITKDGGRSWYRADDVELPRLRHVRVIEDGTIVASGDWSNASLAVVFESRDRGRTWAASHETPSIRPEPTPAQKAAWLNLVDISVVIRDVFHGANQSVWAVGDHGVIIHRPASGQPFVVHRGKDRSPSIVMVANGQNVAWPLLAREALENKNRISLLLDQPSEWRSADSTFDNSDLIRQVATTMGVSSVDAIQSASSNINDVAKTWMSLHRPRVIVLDSNLDADTRRAFAQAAVSAGAQRVCSYSFSGRGDTILHHSAMLPRLGMLVSDLWKDAFSMLAPHDRSPGTIAIKSHYDSSNSRLRSDSITSGISLSNSQLVSAKIEGASRRQLQIAQARLRLDQRVSLLFENSSDQDSFRKNIGTLLNQAAAADRSRLAWTVYQALISNEQPVFDVAGFRETILTEIIDRFPNTGHSQYANVRLAAIQNSDEWRRLRPTLGTWSNPSETQNVAVESVPISPFQSDSQVRQASANVPIFVPQTKPSNVVLNTRRGSRARNEIDLVWEFHPAHLLAADARKRQASDGELQVAGQNNGNLKRLLSSSNGDWVGLLKPIGPRLINAKQTSTRPRLDGQLSDACWRSNSRLLGNTKTVQCAFDDQYVYFAIRSPIDQLTTLSQDGAQQTKVRDKDLTQCDRIELSIDTDRDLFTSYQLTFTADGRTHDSIDSQPEWQPTWYVASQATQGSIDSEVAIARRDLASLPIMEGESWFIRINIIPAGQRSPPVCMPNPNDWKRVRFVGTVNQ